MEEPKDLPPLPSAAELKAAAEPRWVDPKVAKKARKKMHKRRRRHAIKPILLGPIDSAVVFRSSGLVQITHARGEIVMGGSNFWGILLAWLFANTEDADERRKILVEDFMAELAEKRVRAQEAAEKAAAEKIAPAAEPEPATGCPEHGVPFCQACVAELAGPLETPPENVAVGFEVPPENAT